MSWNNRLTRTAGKAHYSRHLDGSEESRIELSYKVVDREDRVRNTLSHEMCHLAAWRFDGNRDGGHGPEWSSWAMKVMQRYPAISITQTHTYDIDYPFKWKCTSCEQVYGRWSNSICTSKQVCICDGELKLIAGKSSRTLTSRLECSTRSPKPSPRTRRQRDACVIDLTCDDVYDVEGLASEVDALDLTCRT